MHGKYCRWEQPGNKATCKAYKAHAVENSPSGEWPLAPMACITYEFCGEHLLAIAVVPQVAFMLSPREPKEEARGDCRLGWRFLLLDTQAGSC